MDKNMLLAKLTGEFKGLASRTTDLDNLDSPEFSNADRVHDWRNHVPNELQDLWSELSMETRLAIAFMAEELANSEEWE